MSDYYALFNRMRSQSSGTLVEARFWYGGEEHVVLCHGVTMPSRESPVFTLKNVIEERDDGIKEEAYDLTVANVGVVFRRVERRNA